MIEGLVALSLFLLLIVWCIRAIEHSEKNDKEARDVEQASAVLQVTTFQFFGIAYVTRYNVPLTPDLVPLIEKKYFVPYMFHNDIPVWVNLLAKNILEEYSKESLDAGKYTKLLY